MKRLALVLTAVTLALALCACAAEGTANLTEYENAYAGYKFSVEKDWASYTYPETSDVRFQSPQDNNGVSAAAFTVGVRDLGGSGAEAYLAATRADISARFAEAVITDITLGGEKAFRAEYAASVGGLEKSFIYVCGANAAGGYFLEFVSSKDDLNTYVTAFDNVLGSFAFTERKPNETPSATVDYSGGRAESVNGDYSFEYPSGWGVVRSDGMLAVAARGSGASVSVSVFALPVEKSSYGAYDYWKEYSEELATVLPGFTVTKEFEKADEPRLGGVVAARKEYSATIDGAEYRYIQIICIYKGYVYSMLFTSDTAEYEAFSPALEDMISSFRFE